MLRLAVFVSGWLATTALAYQTFGSPGMNGRSAPNGQDGRSGKSVSVRADGAGHSFDLRGENGGDTSYYGEDGTPAGYCELPRNPAYDLVGASGGHGGDAGVGGRGGDGGSVQINLNNDGELANLGYITIVNPGGQGGRSSSMAGRGAPGCQCRQYRWDVAFCDWKLYKTSDGTPAYQTETRECYPDPRFPGEPVPPPAAYGYEWRLQGSTYRSFSCTDGEHGRDGRSARDGSDGSYGTVQIVVGTAVDKEVSSWRTQLGNLINNTYQLAGFLTEWRSGLQNLLGGGSDVSNGYSLSKHQQRRVKFLWKPQKSPQEVGADKLAIAAQLVAVGGNVDVPGLELNIPPQLTRKVEVVGDTTTVTFTHLLGSTDPNKIAACAKHHGKGSYVCEFNGTCRYEDGECIPSR